MDERTGSLQVVGQLPNPNHDLRPGMLRGSGPVGLRRGAILVPQRAVTELQGTYQVAVVDATNTVHIVPVQAETGSAASG